MPARRPGLWAEIALALALITLATILLNAGVYWLLIRTTEADRRTDLALSLGRALAAQLEVQAMQGEGDAGFRRVLGAYANLGLQVDELYLVGPDLQPLAAVAGQPPRTPDAGLRAALYAKEPYSELDGASWGGDRAVVVTLPVAPKGRVVGAVRVRLPVEGSPVPGGLAGFALGYTAFSGLAIALFGMSLFRRRLIRPVSALTAGTARIAAGEFGHVVTVDAAHELQELCGALNTMSASLAGYRGRTAEQLERLEGANRELREAQEALVRSEKLAGVGRLAAGLAHEVGNPLSAVLGYMELLQAGLGDPDLERDLAARSRRELDRIHRIIRQLLDYARAGTGQAEDLDVVAAAAEAIETVRHQPAFRDARARLEHPGEVPPVRMEADKLHQVLVNLLLNAADALKGRPERQVTLEVRAVDAGDGRAVELRCLDTGHGFSEVALDRAFEPFFTTRDVGEGTGLGLATCLQVVETAGGRISLANRPGGGAVVTVRLPAAPAELPVG